MNLRYKFLSLLPQQWLINYVIDTYEDYLKDIFTDEIIEERQFHTDWNDLD